LLGVFKRGLLPDVRLTIASNDPVLRNLKLPGGVRVIAGIKDPIHLARLYRESDLLVLPTRADCYSLVVCEAAAQGVPSVATRVGTEAAARFAREKLPVAVLDSTVGQALSHLKGVGLV
jgi:glycosyltransferase involved in cell wall biosynthesis